MFISHCKNRNSLSQYVTIDEMLLEFRGRCSFREYIPSKPNKIFAMTDAQMFYTANMEVYVGQQPTGPFQVSNSPTAMVKAM